MAIVCFRNMLDPKMKRLGSFLKRIQRKNSSNVAVIYSPRKYDYIQAISSNIDATFIIVAHGSENEKILNRNPLKYYWGLILKSSQRK